MARTKFEPPLPDLGMLLGSGSVCCNVIGTRFQGKTLNRTPPTAHF